MLPKKIYTFISLICLISIMFLSSCLTLQKSLAEKVLRLHILADSNSVFEQELKLKVRDGIINYLTPLLKDSSNITETKQIVSANISKINDVAQNIVSSYSNHKTSTTLSSSTFPTKNYGKISFPAGNYEALKITIGEGKGNNWWCVMFPPLCFTNDSTGFFDEFSGKTLQTSLSEEEYYMVNNYDKPNVKIKFKLLEWLNS